MQRDIRKHLIGIVGLTAIGVGTMIGSGWLFSSYYASKIAGPYAYFSWIITCIIILALGLCLSEIATIYPKTGLMARLLAISHNKDFGIVSSLATLLGLTAVIATEALGTIQYLAAISPEFGSTVFNSAAKQLTFWGTIIAILIILVYGLLNFWGARILSHSNIVLTIWKVVIPVLTAITVIVAAFHSSNFSIYTVTNNGKPGDMSSVFVAIIAAGMIYSFNGFQNIVSFSSECKKPSTNIPIATISAVVITLIVYIFLQTSFIGAINPSLLKNGWSNVNFSSPFVQLTAILNLNAIMILLYADSVISPAGTGLIYTGGTTRLLTGMSQDGQMPKYFDKYCAFNFSRRSLITIIILSIVFLLLFRSWTSLVSFLSVFYVISYMAVPISLGKLHSKGQFGIFKIPLPKIVLPLLFIILSCLFCFSKFPQTFYVTIFMLIAYVLYLTSEHIHNKALNRAFKNSCLIMIYLVVLAIISIIGPHAYGGYGFISMSAFFIALAIVSLITYFLSIKWKLHSS